eukprot:3163-Prymnesium_polylepis.1
MALCADEREGPRSASSSAPLSVSVCCACQSAGPRLSLSPPSPVLTVVRSRGLRLSSSTLRLPAGPAAHNVS